MTTKGWHTCVLMLLATPLAGCAMPGQVHPLQPVATAETHDPTVIAIIDTGIHPYHNLFKAEPGEGVEQYADLFGAQLFDISSEGSYDARVEADAAKWREVKPGQLYAFAGTRLLGLSLSILPGDGPMLSTSGHGTQAASMLAREDPNAFILVIQIDTGMCDLLNPPDCPIYLPAAEAMEWISNQPWIDVVSLSLGYPGNPPMRMGPEEARFVAASRAAYEQGKIIISGAGNTINTPLMAQYGGPAWVIAVGGAQPTQRGDQIEASKGADVLANYTTWVVDHQSIDGWTWNQGTSFSAPLVAGTVAHSLSLLRDRGMSVQPENLRAALNASALVWDATAWNPTNSPTNSSTANFGAISTPILFPGQSGWGYVDGSLAPEIARRVLENDLAVPPEKAQTAQYMAQWQSLREQYWANAP